MYQRKHVRSNRGTYAYASLCKGQGKLQAERMQGVAVDARVGRAVKIVAKQGVTDIREVHADLMRAPRARLDTHK
jgi:hypothetical protein